MSSDRWISPKDAVAIGMLASVSFLVEISLGLILTPVISGIPLIGGTLSAVPDAAVVFLGAYLVPRRGGITLFALILLTLSTITPSFGPPGLYKIFIGLALGLIFEAVLLLGRRHTWSYFVGTSLAFAASIPVTYWAWKVFGLPGVEALAPRIPLLMAIYATLALFGAWLGRVVYERRLRHIPAIERLRSGK